MGLVLESQPLPWGLELLLTEDRDNILCSGPGPLGSVSAFEAASQLQQRSPGHASKSSSWRHPGSGKLLSQSTTQLL